MDYSRHIASGTNYTIYLSVICIMHFTNLVLQVQALFLTLEKQQITQN